MSCLDDYVTYVVKYPFSKEGRARFREIVEKGGLYVDELLNTSLGRLILDRAVEILKESLTEGRVDDSRLGEEELVAHYVATIIMAHMDRALWRRFADAESKRFSSNLLMENLDCTIHIAHQFGVRAVRVRDITRDDRLIVVFDVGVRVWDYLKYMPNDPYWKLANRYLLRGWVLLTRKELVRLIEEAVESLVLEMINKSSQNIEETKPIFDAVRSELMNIKISVPKRATQSPRSIPPCMEAIVGEIRGGGNPSHHARFAVAAFLLRRCRDEGRGVEECVEDVVNLFRTVADFNERITRYHVEHIAGLRGGRKFYMPPSCREMNTLGLCPVNLACGIKNPLQYTRMSQNPIVKPYHEGQ